LKKVDPNPLLGKVEQNRNHLENPLLKKWSKNRNHLEIHSTFEKG